MTIWIDADACPREIKEIVFRASRRLNIPVRLVANGAVSAPRSALISVLLVPHGMDKADDRIVQEVATEDLVVTADVPLAARVVEKGALAIDPRGELYSEENVRQRLSMRDFMAKLRSADLTQAGPAPFGPADKQRFANALDRLMARRFRKEGETHA